MVRYRTAADIANEVMRRVVEAVQPGRRVYELCAYGDGLILESTSRVFKKSGVEKGIAKPTSIAVNNCLSNYSALEDDLQVLHHGDLVKIELAVHIDGYVAAAAHTTVINPKPDQPVLGRAADVVCAAYFGLEVALRILKAGNKVSEVTTALSKVAQAFKCHTTIEPGHKAIAQARRNVLEPAAATQTRAKDEDHVFEAGQVWTVNVLMSSGDGKVKEKAEVKPTVYQRNVNKTFNLKLKVSRTVYNEISKRFSVFPFSIRALEDKRGRLGILECVQHNLLEPYPVYFDQSAAYVAQFKCTVLVPPNSTMPLRITSCPPLPYVHSEFSILNDRDMGAILRTPIKTVSNGQVVLISAVPGGSSKDTKGKAKSAPPADGAVEDGV
ncbi:Erbb3 binding protein 1 [Hyaloraphidium curvatum]|nr:Erbb3 binding protein 1 [Hyaloraphidium curvatum]